ncbi:MAG: SdpI family protein [Victivallales bacterium]|nr:SdpI family protein [Victivallales bacterium]
MKKAVSWILLAAVWLASILVFVLKIHALEVFAIPVVMTVLLIAMTLFQRWCRRKVIQLYGEGSHEAVVETRNLEALSNTNLLSCVLLTAVHGFILYCRVSGRGDFSGLEKILAAFLGLLLVVVGNLLPKLRPNKYVGIRLPWLMHDEARWAKTHHFGGFAMVFCGVAMLGCAVFTGISSHVALAMLLFTVGCIVAYSLLVKG